MTSSKENLIKLLDINQININKDYKESALKLAEVFFINYFNY